MKTSLFKIIFALVFCLSPFFVSASSTDTISGYAWSSNIGWISMNCTNDSSCATSNYGVNQDANGNITGYAWSPNIGWVSFNRLITGNPPSNDSGTGAIAKVNLTTGAVTGWAKALSADGNGWDGWISLSGTTTNGSSYGVTLTSTGSTSYTCPKTDCAWGSDVVGWVDFSGVIGPAVLTTYTVTPSVSVLGSSGTISPSTAQTVNSGATPTFQIDATGASLSYSIGNETGACPHGSNDTGDASPTSYTTGVITASCTVIVTFSTNPPNNNGLPVVKYPTYSVSGTGATLGATVTDLGNPNATKAGIVWWSSSDHPLNYTPTFPLDHPIFVSSFPKDRAYTISPPITGLIAGTTYHYAGFASNATNGIPTSADTTFSAPDTFTISAPGAGSCGPGSSTTPQQSKPAGTSACKLGTYSDLTDTTTTWNWSCGTAICSAPNKSGVVPGTPGACDYITIPYYGCSNGVDSTNRQTYPSIVTWTCPSNVINGTSVNCSKPKGPDFKEN